MATYGLSISIFGSLPRKRALAKVAAAGFGAVELSADAAQPDNWLGDPGSMRRDLAEAGLKAWSVHSPGISWDLAARDETVRLAGVEAAAWSFRPAREVGAEVVVCHCNAPKEPFDPADYDGGLARTADSLKRLAERACKIGVRLGVENMIPRPGKRPATRVSELLALIEGLGDHVGICLDTGHNHATGANVADEALLAGAKLFSLHIQDNHGVPDQDEHLIPGRGTIDWAGLLDALDRLSFEHPRILEVKLLPGEDAVSRTLRELAALLVRWQSGAG